MIPLRDENPTRRPAVLTWVMITACVGVFVFVQPDATRSLDTPNRAQLVEEIEFSYQYAAIPCELTQGRPLTVREVADTQVGGIAVSCDPTGHGTALFPSKNVWLAVLVSMFLHGSWIHLIGNMVFLWVFGNNIEDHLGTGRYLAFYLLAGVIATGAHVVVQVDSTVPLIGASGAVAGVMGAYLVWFPWARVRTLVILGIIPLLIRIPAAILLGLWFASQFLIGSGSGVAWMAHVAGFAFGVIAGLVARSDPRFRNRLWAHRYRTTGKGLWDNRRGPRVV